MASRLVIPALGIDLPVVSGELELPGGPPDLPLCGVAHYSPAYRQPGEVGTAYLYGHAQRGMLLPLLRASERADGRELLGMTVEVYTNDGLRHTYRIGTVRRHATNYHLADSVRPGDQRLVIQTSEGPEGTVPKLQVAAAHVASEQARLADALPIADPRPCG